MAEATTIRSDTAERHRRKYADANPIHRLTLGRFHDSLAAELRALSPRSILDFGCGEGFLVDKMLERGVALDGYVGLDLREDAIGEARTRHPAREFIVDNVFNWPNDGRRFELVLASQVLEHLFEPERYLRRLAALSSRHLLLTVPQEPWFQLMNLARGRDFIRLGNHPEHINHWSQETFEAFAAPYMTVARAWTVFPFVFIRGEAK